MAALNETPSANRIHIAFFGLRNAGKSTLVNAFCGQDIAIVSDVAGTTTDPVSKAMEILPLGPCLITDTAGLDDEGELGALRVQKTLAVLATTDIAVWVEGEGIGNREQGIGRGRSPSAPKDLFLSSCRRLGVTVFEYHRGDDVEELKKKIASVKLEDEMPGLLDGLVTPDTRVICVCPIDESAPKGRLILPQVQVIRACLDQHIPCTVVQPSELRAELESLVGGDHRAPRKTISPLLIITDSQAFREVRAILSTSTSTSTSSLDLSLTSFSILFARQKGDLAAFEAGLEAIEHLKDGDTVLIAEGCTHHRQCNDIGRVKIPKALEKLSGKKLNYVFASGHDFLPSTLNPHLSRRSIAKAEPPTFNLIIQCGGCMLTRREMLRRIALAKSAAIPIVNYGMLLSRAALVARGQGAARSEVFTGTPPTCRFTTD